MRHLFEVTNLDLTDVPPARSTAAIFIVDMPAEGADDFADRLSAHCDRLSDGNDFGYDVSYSCLDEVDVKTPEAAEAWLLAFGVESVFGDE